jgi:hypothetical protein
MMKLVSKIIRSVRPEVYLPFAVIAHGPPR